MKAKSEVNLLTRRTLLTTAAAAVGAASFPTIVPASVLGRGGRMAPSNRIVLGHIGVGGQGTQHVVGGPWTQKGGMTGRDDVQVVAVCDVNLNRRENARHLVNERYGNSDCAVYDDFRDLLARKDIDAVLIATGERWHPLISMAAAKAGKDVYSEKPTSVTIAEALALRQTVRDDGIVFQQGTQQRSSYSFRFACELVQNGYIGQLKEVVVGVAGGPTYKQCTLPAQPVPQWLDYEMWLGPAPYRPYNESMVGGWMAYRDFSGGEMTNWGAHHWDIAQWGSGNQLTGPSLVVPPNGKDVKTLTYHFKNGVTYTRDPERTARESPDGNGVLFVGTKGKVAVWRYDLKTWPENLKQVKIGPNEIHLHEAENHHTDWLNAIRTRSRPGADIAISARSITVAHLGNIAYELGRPVQWNPDTETFVNDPDAERLISRTMRSPWHL